MAGVALALALASVTDRSPSVVLGMAVVAAATFFILVMGAKVATGRESLTFFHHLVAIAAACAGFVVLIDAPVLASLDLAVLGVFTFLAFGRMGCLAVGCCHGRPWRRGVVYGEAHVAEGFPPALAGIPLVPVQAVEAGWDVVVVAAGAAVVLAAGPAGGAVVVAVCLYSLVRWPLELARGDPGRAHPLGFSEAQWTSLLATASLAVAGGFGRAPLGGLAAAATAVLATATIVVGVSRRGRAYRLLLPAHVVEVATALDGLEETSAVQRRGAVVVARTSLGVCLSGRGGHHAVSREAPALDEGSALALARAIGWLRPASGPRSVVAGGHGVFHVVAKGASDGV